MEITKETICWFIKKLETDKIIKITEKEHFNEAVIDSYEDFLINCEDSEVIK